MGSKNVNRENNLQVRLLAAKLMKTWQDADEVAHVLGCRRSFVKKWHQRFQQGGRAALRSASTVGRPSKLNPAQKQVVREILFNRSPLEFGFSHTLWTNKSVRNLIELLYRVKLRMPSVNNLLERFGVKQAPFEKTTAPKEILTQARVGLEGRHRKFMLFFHYPIEVTSNEFDARLSARSKYASERRQPVARAWLAGAIDTRHSKWFMVSYLEPVEDRFVAFVEKLIDDTTKPISLIVADPGIWDAPAVHALRSTYSDELKLIRDNGQPRRVHREISGE